MEEVDWVVDCVLDRHMPDVTEDIPRRRLAHPVGDQRRRPLAAEAGNGDLADRVVKGSPLSVDSGDVSEECPQPVALRPGQKLADHHFGIRIVYLVN